MHVLAGVHTSGKTTVGQLLRLNGFIFVPEIALEEIGDLAPWDLRAEFDENVISRELDRDAQLRSLSAPFFVETWHPGNLAYARVRNPSVASNHVVDIITRVREFRPRLYFLDMPPELLCARTQYFRSDSDRAKAVTFYSHVRLEFYRVFEILGLKPVIIDAATTHDKVLSTVLAHEMSHCGDLVMQQCAPSLSNTPGEGDFN